MFLDGLLSPLMDMLAVDPCAAIPQLNYRKNDENDQINSQKSGKDIQLILHVKHDRCRNKKSGNSEETSDGIQITSGLKKFLCPKCNRGFTLKANCQRHFKVIYIL